MATINTIEDLIRILDENPEWTEALRSRLLTRELLELPARFAEYAESNNERLDTIEARLDTIEARLDTIEARLDTIEARLDTIEARLDTLDRQLEIVKAQLQSLELRIDRLDRRMERFEDDMARFRSRHASEMVKEQSDIMADELGYRKVQTLTRRDLLRMVNAADTEDISRSDLRSFRRADLIVEAVEDSTGESCYLAVEISFTVNGRDTTRAIRNAKFLSRFTGLRAVPVVSGVRKDDLVNSDLTAGNVSWFEIEDEDLETE